MLVEHSARVVIRHSRARISQCDRAPKIFAGIQREGRVRRISRALFRTINKQGDGFTHNTIWVFQRATKKPEPGRSPTQQRCHSQFKTTTCSAAHLDGPTLSDYIILICQAELVGQCLGPRDKWRTFQMTGAGQPQPVIPLIATHSSAAFLAAVPPGAPQSVFEFVPIMVMGHMPPLPHAHARTPTHIQIDILALSLHHTYTALLWLCVKCSKSQSPRPASFVCPQLFRPGACIVLPGSLPEALWPETSSLIGPQRDRGELFLLCLVCCSIMFCFLLRWQLDC